jgi:hypothetical protein
MLQGGLSAARVTALAALAASETPGTLSFLYFSAIANR